MEIRFKIHKKVTFRKGSKVYGPGKKFVLLYGLGPRRKLNRLLRNMYGPFRKVNGHIGNLYGPQRKVNGHIGNLHSINEYIIESTERIRSLS